MTSDEIFNADKDLETAMFWEANEQILKDIRNNKCL